MKEMIKSFRQLYGQEMPKLSGKEIMNCIIDVGGGNRDVMAAGVFDRLMDDHIAIDCCIGVSAGAANCCSYAAGQRGRNLKFYTGYNFSPRAIGLLAWLKTGGSMVDMDYIYQELSGSKGRCPLDYEAYAASDIDVKYVATDALTGRPVYFGKNEITKDNYGVLSASSAHPLYCKPYDYKGRTYFDGFLSDPIPVKKAVEDGFDKIILILLLPKDHFKGGSKDKDIASRIKNYPKVAELMAGYSKLYNDELKLALELEAQGRCLILAPDSFIEISAVSKNKKEILKIYNDGYKKAEAVRGFL